MGRRIFDERQFKVSGKVISYEDFKPYLDLNCNTKINENLRKSITERAEKRLTEEIPLLIATDYMMYRRDGNRSIYEGKYFRRRDMLMDLVAAEYMEKQGRFLDKIVDVLWLILEETTWVLPAHNRDKEGVNTCLPYAFKNDADHIALFSATTGADLALTYFLLKDELDTVTTIINDRILFELDTRIIKPFLSANCQGKMWWTGVNGNSVNNWCPWITSNVLTVCAFAVKDMQTRESVVRTALPLLDNFIKVYKSDGGCDEGPGYWGAAGGALFNALNVLYDITGGYINIFDDELIRKMGEYEVKVFVRDGRFLTFADCSAKIGSNAALIYEWGTRCNSEMMISYGKDKLDGKPHASVINPSHPYTSFKYLCKDIVEKETFKAPKHFYLDGIIIAGSRESEKCDEGLYIALKGGNNNESHNHNDVGTIIAYADGEPLFIDAGSGAYTKRTFSNRRYEIWSMCSEYHNLPTINGVNQKNGPQYYSEDHVYDEKSGKLEMSLKHAYPELANIDTYTRSAVLENSTITLEDNVKLNDEGGIIFNFLTNIAPENVTENTFTLRGRTITFDDSLRFTCESVDCSEEETRAIPTRWDCEEIYRIRLSSKKDFKEHKYILTIK